MAYSYGLYSYGLYSYGIYSYGLYSYGICGYGLYSYGLCLGMTLRTQVLSATCKFLFLVRCNHLHRRHGHLYNTHITKTA